MIVDSSALVAVLFDEPDADVFAAVLSSGERIRIASPTWVETAVVVEAQMGAGGGASLDLLLARACVETVPFTLEHARVARAAYRDFGKGSGHPARLNLGDCFAYALAKCSREPLLYKGGDFAHTDVRSALPGR